MDLFIKECKSKELEDISTWLLDHYKKNMGGVHSTDNLYGVVREVSIQDDGLENKLKRELIPLVGRYLDEYFSNNSQINKEMFSLNHFSIMHHRDGINLPFHYDCEYVYETDGNEYMRNFAVLMYLNNDFDGGELLFPLQKMSIKPEPGKLLIFPTSFMYPHATAPALGGDRYVLRICYYFNKDEIKATVLNAKSFY